MSIFLYLQAINEKDRQIPEESLKKLIKEIGKICCSYFPNEKIEYTKKHILQYVLSVVTMVNSVNDLLEHFDNNVHVQTKDEYFYEFVNNLLGYELDKKHNMFTDVYVMMKEFQKTYHPELSLNDIFNEIKDVLYELTEDK